MKLINIGLECSNPHLFEERTLCFVFHGEQITASVCGKVRPKSICYFNKWFTVILLYI